jgi:dolichol-phosphate mannosyltransferase
MPEHPQVSIAIPVFNEELLVDELLRRTLAVLDALPGGPHELVIVDDGSHDGTFALLERAAAGDGRIALLQLSRNFGHQTALTAALDHVGGDVIVMMDGDLQDAPEVIPDLLARYHEGFDVVYAIRMGRKEGFLLRSCYKAFYFVMGALANVKLPLDAGDFCVASRRVVDVMRQSREHHRYLRGLRAWAGFRQTGLEIQRQSRHAGQSKYSWAGLFRLAFDGIFSFSIVPLRIATLIGAGTVLLSAAALVFWIAAKLLGYSPQGFTAVATSIAFFAGVQVLFLGIIGEYVGRIYEEVKGRPLYIVRRQMNNRTLWNRPTSSSIDASTSSTGGGDCEKRSCSTPSAAGDSPASPSLSSTLDAATD